MGDGASPEGACRGKHPFPTMRDARRVAGAMNRKRKRPRGHAGSGQRGASPIEAFRCTFCGFFHVGSNGSKMHNVRPVKQARKRINDRLRTQYLDR